MREIVHTHKHVDVAIVAMNKYIIKYIIIILSKLNDD